MVGNLVYLRIPLPTYTMDLASMCQKGVQTSPAETACNREQISMYLNTACLFVHHCQQLTETAQIQ